MRDSPAAISGCFVDYKLIRTRSTLQIIIEVAVERQAEVFAALGYPVPGADIHVALARLVADPARSEAPQPSARSEQGKARYAASTEQQQAVVRAAQYPKDGRFQKWVSHVEGYSQPVTAAEAIIVIRRKCSVDSRALIEIDRGAYDAFVDMETDFKQWAGLMPEVR